MGTEKEMEMTVDRGLARGQVVRAHGLNPVLLVEKILRERVLDSHYWLSRACNMSFWELLRAACTELTLVATYTNSTRTRVSSFMALLLRLLQLPRVDSDVVEWLVMDSHKYKYATVLFMVYARIVWESSGMIHELLDKKLNDYRKIKVFDANGFGITTIDQLADSLVIKSQFFDMALPKLVNRFVLEDSGVLFERESALADEFEQQLEEMDE